MESETRLAEVVSWSAVPSLIRPRPRPKVRKVEWRIRIDMREREHWAEWSSDDGWQRHTGHRRMPLRLVPSRPVPRPVAGDEGTRRAAGDDHMLGALGTGTLLL
jgi:hypothetical protein